MTPLTTIRALLYGLALRCPACGLGRIYRSPFTYQLRVRCPACGIVFERDPGEVTGGMGINMVVTSILGTVGAVYVAFFTNLSMFWVVAMLTILPLAFGLLFHRHARGLWLGVLYVTGAIAEPHPAPSTGQHPSR